MTVTAVTQPAGPVDTLCALLVDTFIGHGWPDITVTPEPLAALVVVDARGADVPVGPVCDAVATDVHWEAEVGDNRVSAVARMNGLTYVVVSHPAVHPWCGRNDLVKYAPHAAHTLRGNRARLVNERMVVVGVEPLYGRTLFVLHEADDTEYELPAEDFLVLASAGEWSHDACHVCADDATLGEADGLCWECRDAVRAGLIDPEAGWMGVRR